MTEHGVNLATVDLANCDQEPIHIPGSIQPHGALLGFDLHGVLTHASRNAATFAPGLPALGAAADADWWSANPALAEAFGEVRDAARSAAGHALRNAEAAVASAPPLAVEAQFNGLVHDAVVHAHDGQVTVELEPRNAAADELASFAMLAHRGMARLKGRSEIGLILAEAVKTVRLITGFDRVMAYRFHPDDSGEVVAEDRGDALDPYLGRRFPASDIPVQARRLYIVNTLRLIADVNDAQVPVDALDPRAAPLDMSSSILRSVSPIHIEYLKNINVAASMSVSIVIGGRLWGLIACHHRSGHRVPYAVRMACDVLAHVVSSAVQVTLERAGAARRAASVDLRGRFVELAQHGDDTPTQAGLDAAAVSAAIACDDVLWAQGSRVQQAGASTAADPADPAGPAGPADPAGPAVSELLRWLDAQVDDLTALDELGMLPEALRAALAPVCGVLALRHDRFNKGFLVLLRNEQTASITWSGPRDKAVRIGPLGLRLTPDGSLAEWRQESKGRAAPWDALDLTIARQLLDELGRASAARAAEMDHARRHLLAILGHDLRDPLQAINMATLMLGRGVNPASMVSRISDSSHRMSRLITQVLDMSRLQGGIGLGMVLQDTDLSAWIGSLVDEACIAYPSTPIQRRIEPAVRARVDQDRLAQVVGNLLGNARQHGTVGQPIVISLSTLDDAALIEVRNAAPPLTPEVIGSLFDPLKRSSLANPRNPNGLGLGLYIASEIAKGHHGTLDYRHEGQAAVFSVRLPRQP